MRVTSNVNGPTHQSAPERSRSQSLRHVAQEFEAYMLTQMLHSMRKAGPKSDLWEHGVAEDIYYSLLDQAIGEGAAKAGGIGLADMLVAQLDPSGAQEASRALGAMQAYSDAARAASVAGTGSIEMPAGALSDVGDRSAPIIGARLGSVFGPRYSKRFKAWKMHYGIDLNAPEGTPIRAAASGVVRVAGERQGYGLAVYIDHGNGVVTRYGHASELLVKPGEHVEAGQVIARVGHTGRADTDHLHFEVRQNGEPVDPTEWLGPELMRRAAYNYEERMKSLPGDRKR